MFNIGSGEIALIAVVALLVLGPKRLPELARGIGKFMREFRRQTDEVRGVVEREFYKMDQEVQSGLPTGEPEFKVRPAQDAVAMGSHDGLHAGLPTGEHLPSQLTAGMPKPEPVVAAAPASEPAPSAQPTEPAPVDPSNASKS